MENNIRFRNHISIIFERAARGVGFIVFAFVGSFISDIGEMDEARIGSEIWILLAVLLGFLVLLLGWQFIVWARTFITIQENVIVVERKTLNRKKNTIGIKNISNVNLEQNLLKMLLGTCTVKLDTNSLSTANETDLLIVLKKKDAENFRQMILNKTRGEAAETVSSEEITQRKYVSDLDDIVMHGLFSINVLSVVVFLAAIVFAFILCRNTLSDPEVMLLEAIMSILVSVWVLAGMAWEIIQGFIKYAEFQIERKDDKILLSYGILKKAAYSIPVDKINAVRLNQTLLARIGKFYMVEVINVGMDDDASEAYSFFLPYSKKEKLRELLGMLLPEFVDCLEIEEQRQQKCIWIIWIPKVILYFLFMTAAFAVLTELFEGIEIAIIVGIILLGISLLAAKVMAFFTEGYAVHPQFLKIVSGHLGKRSLFVKYDKIQYVITNQNVVAKQFHVEKGQIHILAAVKNQIHILPYCKENDLEELRKSILR